jgi:acyl carrier protein
VTQTKPLNNAEALSLVKDSVTQIVPDADFTLIRPDDRFRDVLELDSLDFLSLIELLSEQAGVRIDEEDYPNLTTLADTTRFLVERTRQGS